MLTCRVNPTLHPRGETAGNGDIPIGGFFSLSSFSFFCFPVSAFPKFYPFFFHALPHSFALAFLLKPLESSNSALFAQNTGGGGYPPQFDLHFFDQPSGYFPPDAYPLFLQ